MKALGVLFSLILTTLTMGTEYKVDPAHSHVGFKVRYMMLSSVKGQFNIFNGRVTLSSGGDIQQITGNIDVSSIDTNNKKRDAHLRSDDFFNANVYPDIKFKTNKVVSSDVGFTAVGELEIHGITNQVAIPFTLTDSLIDVYGNERIGLEGGLRVNRKEYGIMYSKKMDNGGLVVDDHIEIELNIQLIKESS